MSPTNQVSDQPSVLWSIRGYGHRADMGDRFAMVWEEDVDYMWMSGKGGDRCGVISGSGLAGTLDAAMDEVEGHLRGLVS